MEKKLELPVYLFHQGTAERAYELMGCHPETKKGRKGYVFRVWAPNAAEVYLIGDFNQWEDSHPMKKLTEQGIWELFVPELEEYTAYKYSGRGPLPRSTTWKDTAGKIKSGRRPSPTKRLSISTRYIWAPGGRIPTAIPLITSRWRKN